MCERSDSVARRHRRARRSNATGRASSSGDRIHVLRSRGLRFCISFGEATVSRSRGLRRRLPNGRSCSPRTSKYAGRIGSPTRRRDLLDWFVLDRGASGVSAIYDAWCPLRARLSGTTFRATISRKTNLIVSHHRPWMQGRPPQRCSRQSHTLPPPAAGQANDEASSVLSPARNEESQYWACRMRSIL